MLLLLLLLLFIRRVESRDPIENIPYYQNKRTGVVKWDIPLDVRTHLSPESEAKVSYFNSKNIHSELYYIIVLHDSKNDMQSRKSLNEFSFFFTFLF